MKQGVLIVEPNLIARPDVFDALCDAFEIIRHLEIDQFTHALICEHEQFDEVAEGDFLPCYHISLSRQDDAFIVSGISQPFINQNIALKCQRKKETNSNQVDREANQENLIWMPEQ